MLDGITVYGTHQRESKRGSRRFTPSEASGRHVRFTVLVVFGLCGSQLFPKLAGGVLGGRQVT